MMTAARPGYAPATRAASTTEPFNSAEEAWFWTMAALGARRDGARIVSGAGLVQRPCEPDDVVRCPDRLYRQRRIDLQHARILRIWGERQGAPDPRAPRERGDARLWREAMQRLDWPLRAKGIVAGAPPGARGRRGHPRLPGRRRVTTAADAARPAHRRAAAEAAQRAFIVFGGGADLPWQRPLRCGFRHCFAALEDADGWTVLDPLSGRLVVARLDLPRGFDLPGFYRRAGLAVLGPFLPGGPRRSALRPSRPSPAFRSAARCSAPARPSP